MPPPNRVPVEQLADQKPVRVLDENGYPKLPPPQSVKTAPEIDDEREDGQRAKREMDPELRVTGQILRLLQDLDPKTRLRVINWLEWRTQEDCGLDCSDLRFTTTKPTT